MCTNMELLRQLSLHLSDCILGLQRSEAQLHEDRPEWERTHGEERYFALIEEMHRTYLLIEAMYSNISFVKSWDKDGVQTDWDRPQIETASVGICIQVEYEDGKKK